MKLLFISSFLLPFLIGTANAQQTKKDTAGIKLPYVVQGKDTIPVYIVEDTRVEQKMDEADLQKQKEWNRMVYDVMKVYPYAVACANKIKQIQLQMDSMDRRKDKKQFLKTEEERVKTEYSQKLEQLSPRQGRILAKLINRQTGQTSYELIKQYKNGMTAFFWQGVASVYGVSLKDTYDPNEEPQLEAVLQYLGYK